MSDIEILTRSFNIVWNELNHIYVFGGVAFCLLDVVWGSAVVGVGCYFLKHVIFSGVRGVI